MSTVTNKINTLSKRAQRNIKVRGLEGCVLAFKMNEAGDGARSIGEVLGLTTNTVDAMIDAGREFTEHIGDLETFVAEAKADQNINNITTV